MEIDLLQHAQFVVPWESLCVAVRANLKEKFGADPDECVFDPRASEAGVVKCYFRQGVGPWGVPFQIEIDLGILAERYAAALLRHPVLAPGGYRLIGGSIWTDEHGTIHVAPEGPKGDHG